jgi:hypothetical protein
MTLAADLSSSFGSGGFNLDVSVTGLGTLLDSVSPVPINFDASAIAGLTELLGQIDTGGIGRLVEPIAAIVARIGPSLPAVGPLFARLQAILDGANLATSGDLAGLPARIDAAGAVDGEAGMGLPALEASVHGLAALASDPTIHGILELVRPVLPGFDLTAPGEILGGPAGGLVSLIQLIAGLMAVETASREIERMAVLIDGMLAAGRVQDLMAALRSTTGPGLPGLLTGLPPDDPGVVDAVAAPMIDYVDALRTLADLVMRGFAFGEATLAHAGFDGLALRLEAGTLLLDERAIPPVEELARTVVGWLQPALQLPLPAGSPGIALAAEIGGLAASLNQAVDGIDGALLAGPVRQGLDAVLTPLRSVDQMSLEVTAAIRSAFRGVEDVLDSIDLRPVQEALNSVLRPVTDAIASLTELMGGAQAAITSGAEAVVGALTPLKAGMNTVATTILGAFQSVASALEALNLDELQSTLSRGINQVADAVNAAQLRPVFDVASGVINTGADLLGAVPKALLPDDVLQELEAACAPLQALDLEPVRQDLKSELDAIIAGIDTDVLADLDQAFQAVLDFLDDIDPEAALTELEAQAFSGLAERLRQVDPTTPLAPVIQALEELKSAVASLDPAAALAPVDRALDEVSHAIDSLDATALLGPIEDQLDAFRTWVDDTLQLPTWAGRLTAIDTLVSSQLDRVDLEGLLQALEQSWGDLVAQVRAGSESAGASVLGTLVAGLAEGMGLGVQAESFQEVLAWIRRERDGSAVVRDRLRHAGAALEHTRSSVSGLDLQSIVGELESVHRRVLAAITSYPEGSMLRDQFEQPVRIVAPMALMGSTLANRERYLQRLAAAVGVLVLEGVSDRTEIQVIAEGMARAFQPLRAAPDKVRELLAVLGLDSSGLSLRESLARLMEQLSPSQLNPLAAVVGALKTKLAAMVHDGLVAPLQEGVGELTDAFAAIDIGFLGDEISSIRGELAAKVDSVRPTHLLSEVLTAFGAAKTALAGFDPFAAVKEVVDELKEAIREFAEQFRPTRLLRPALDLYHELRSSLGALSVRDLLQPVLTALHGIEQQLEEGMDEVIDALEALNEACASDGGLLPDIGISVDAGISF